MRREPPHVLRVANRRFPMFSTRCPAFAIVSPDADELRAVLDLLAGHADTLELHLVNEGTEMWAFCTWREEA